MVIFAFPKEILFLPARVLTYTIGPKFLLTLRILCTACFRPFIGFTLANLPVRGTLPNEDVRLMFCWNGSAGHSGLLPLHIGVYRHTRRSLSSCIPLPC